MIEIAPGLFRGPRPTQADIDAHGIRTVIDLEMNYPDVFPGVTTRRVPMSSWILTPPTVDQLRAVTLLTYSEQSPTLICCRQGVDRTGMAVAYYRVHVQDWTVRKAIDEMLEMGFHRWRYFYWLTKAKELLA